MSETVSAHGLSRRDKEGRTKEEEQSAACSVEQWRDKASCHVATDRWSDEPTDGPTDGPTDEPTDEPTDGQTDTIICGVAS